MSLASVTLQEWETLNPEPGSALYGLSLGTDQAVADVVNSLARSNRLQVTELRTGLLIKATSFVGRLQLGTLRITIRPKLTGLPLVHLLRYAYGLRNLDLSSPVEYQTEDWAFQDLIVNQLAAEAEELLARGLHRRYIRTDEELSSPRGRIDVSSIARRATSLQTTLPCSHYPRLEDCLINQVLLSGLLLATRMTTDTSLKITLHRIAAVLQEDISTVRLDYHCLARLHREMSRLTTAYEPAITLIELLLASQGISWESRSSDVPLPGFLFDMNRFFQALLSRFLAENLSGYTVRDEVRLKGMLAYHPAHNPRNRRSPEPRPDFVVFDGTRPLAVLDAKYRDLWENGLPDDMLYQLTIYALSRLGQGESAILYSTLHPEAKEAHINVLDPIHGDTDATVILRPVDMNLLASLVSPTPGHQKERERETFAHHLAFGDTKATPFLLPVRPSP